MGFFTGLALRFQFEIKFQQSQGGFLKVLKSLLFGFSLADRAIDFQAGGSESAFFAWQNDGREFVELWHWYIQMLPPIPHHVKTQEGRLH